MLVLAVLLTAASTGVFVWQRVTGPAVPDRTASLGGLTTEVRGAGWVDFDMGHVMDGQGGFMMPDAMMPGAPRGEEVRLGVAVTLHNPGAETRALDLTREFAIVGGGTESPARPVADTIGALPRLGPGAAVDGLLYFDLVPDLDAGPLYLRWSRDGRTVRIAVPLDEGEQPPPHRH